MSSSDHMQRPGTETTLACLNPEFAGHQLSTDTALSLFSVIQIKKTLLRNYLHLHVARLTASSLNTEVNAKLG